MIHEYLLGEKSAWAHYFRVLPTKFDTLMFWTDSELSELQASAIVDKIGKQDAEKSILDMVAPIVRANPLLFPPVEGLSFYDGEGGARILLELAHRMGSLIMAYAFDIEKSEDEESDGEDGYVTDDEDQLPKGMVPLADLLNADGDRNNVSFNPTCSAESLRLMSFPFSSGATLPGRKVFGDEGYQTYQSGRRTFQRLRRNTSCGSSEALWLCHR